MHTKIVFIVKGGYPPFNFYRARLLKISNTEEKLYELLGSHIADMEYELVRIKFSAADKSSVLQIMIDFPEEDRSINIEDCEKVSRYVSNILDVEDPISTNYNLEVSSPGLDRPLVFVDDFNKFTGNKVFIKTETMIEGSKKFKGLLVGVKNDEKIELRPETQVVKGKKASKKKAEELDASIETIEIPYNDIVAANIIFEGV